MRCPGGYGAGGAVLAVLHPTSSSGSPLLTLGSHPCVAAPGTAGTPRGKPALGGPLGGVTHPEPWNSLAGSFFCQHVHAQARTWMYIYAHTRACTCTDDVCNCAHACTRAKMRTHVHKCTHTCTNIHKRTHICTKSHTCTPPGTSRAQQGHGGARRVPAQRPAARRGPAAPWGCWQEPSSGAQSGDACTRQRFRLTRAQGGKAGCCAPSRQCERSALLSGCAAKMERRRTKRRVGAPSAGTTWHSQGAPGQESGWLGCQTPRRPPLGLTLVQTRWFFSLPAPERREEGDMIEGARIDRLC